MKDKDQSILGKAYQLISEGKTKDGNYNILSSEKRKITEQLINKGLDGNTNFHSKAEALDKATEALHKLGYSLDMVPASSIQGDNGHVNLPFRKYSDKTPHGNPHPEILNCTIAFNWYLRGHNKQQQPNYEVVAYASL